MSLVNTPGRNASAVAEFTIAAILAETRLIRAGHEALRQGVWRGDLYRSDDTVRAQRNDRRPHRLWRDRHPGGASLLKPFGCRILVADPYVQLSRRIATMASSRSISTAADA